MNMGTHQIKPDVRFPDLGPYSIGSPSQGPFTAIQFYDLPIQGPQTFISPEGLWPSIQAIQAQLAEHRTLLEGILTAIRGTALHRETNVVVSTFSPEPYTVKQPIPVNIRLSGESFIASFFDANISTSGETEEEAFSNLKSLLVETFDFLESLPEQQLGPEPLRQITVLRDFVSAE
jgi:predicted RNase H-like HicB family nuclease